MKKKYYILTIISFILLIFMVVGVSYAACKFSATGTKENVISTDCDLKWSINKSIFKIAICDLKDYIYFSW